MATKKRIVYGATTQWSEDGTTFSDVPECNALAVPTTEIEYLDATHLQSPGGYREFIPGLKDAGTIEIPCGYSSDGYETAYGYQTNGTLVQFETTMPLEAGQSEGDKFAFEGYVTPQLETNEVGEIINLTIAVRISGAPTFTKGAPVV